jgi:hypothetical protein
MIRMVSKSVTVDLETMLNMGLQTSVASTSTPFFTCLIQWMLNYSKPKHWFHAADIMLSHFTTTKTILTEVA